MVESMKAVATKFAELTVEERNLLSVAYKNVIGARRASWRIIQSIEHKEEGRGASAKLELIKSYRSQVEKELRDICQVCLPPHVTRPVTDVTSSQDILSLLDKSLIPAASNGESKVFFFKM